MKARDLAMMAIGAWISELFRGMLPYAVWRASRVDLGEMHGGAVAFRAVFP